MEKGAQFYFIAAIIIVIILTGLAGVSNYIITKGKPLENHYYKSELSREGYKIIEYGIYNKKDVGKLLVNFTGEQYGEFFLRNSNNANIFFLFGNKSKMIALQYNEGVQGDVIGSNGWIEDRYYKTKEIMGSELIRKDFIEVNLLSRNYKFDLINSEMFYFIIVNVEGGETFIEINK